MAFPNLCPSRSRESESVTAQRQASVSFSRGGIEGISDSRNHSHGSDLTGTAQMPCIAVQVVDFNRRHLGNIQQLVVVVVALVHSAVGKRDLRLEGDGEA